MSELDFVIETDTFDEVGLMGCCVEPITTGYHGLARWVRLATAALKDLVTSGAISSSDLPNVTLFLALPPATRIGVDARLPQLLGARITQALGVSDFRVQTRVYSNGHASGAHACRDALAALTSRAIDRAIICGVDSLIESDTLKYYLSHHRLKTPDQPDGFVPGEGAACILLERADDTRARGGLSLAVIDGAHVALEPVTILAPEPSPATGLAEAIQGTLSQLFDGGAGTRLVVSDLNGETYRAKEFANAAVRTLASVPGGWRVWHPADCIGDTGAAAFIVAVCVATRALARGYSKGERAIVLGSSDEGLRGSVALRRIQEN
jgi:3-oxoacyl-[acyl-carrier-protein] synthase-1